MNNYTDYEDAREINLKDLCRFIFRKWKVMLVWAILFTALFCGYSALRYTISRSGNPSPYDTALKSYQADLKNYQDSVDQYDKAIQDYNNQLNKTTDPDNKVSILNNISAAQDAKDKLTQPDEPSVLKNTPSVEGYVKYGLIGFIVGALAYAVLVTIRYVTDNKVHDGDEPAYIYHLRKLGTVTDQKKSGKDQDPDHTEQYGMISALIDNLNETGENVVVTGPVSDKELKVQSSRLEESNGMFHYLPVSKVTTDPSSYKKVSSYKYAVVIVKRDRSSLNDLNDLVSYLAAAGTTILGYLVI